MTYGYRLNVGDVFFRLADLEHKRACIGEVKDFRGTQEVSFLGPKDNEAVASCVVAIVGWAVAVESVINLAWNHLVTPQIPTKLGPTLLKQLRTMEKLDYLVKEVAPAEIARPQWQGKVAELFELRNRFVHFKEEVVYQGFEFAPPLARTLSHERLLSLREAAAEAVRYLSTKDDRLRTDYLDGKYVVAYDEE